MKLELSLKDLTPEALADLCLERMAEKGLTLRPPERHEPFTVREAAEALRVSVHVIYADLAAGRMPEVPRMGVKRIPAWAVRMRQAGGDPMEHLERMAAENFG
jgi:hypothetical protein